MNNEDLTKKVIAIDEVVTRHTEQIKTCFAQIAESKNLAESVHKLVTTVEILVREQKSTNEKMDKLSGEIEEIKEKPAKRWDLIVTALISGVVGFLLTQIGLK